MVKWALSDNRQLLVHFFLQLVNRQSLGFAVVIPEVESHSISLVLEHLVDAQTVHNPADVHVNLLLVQLK